MSQGSSLNLSTMTFGENTKVVRNGTGRIIFGESRKIYRGIKARNLDGSVNYTEIQLM